MHIRASRDQGEYTEPLTNEVVITSEPVGDYFIAYLTNYPKDRKRLYGRFLSKTTISEQNECTPEFNSYVLDAATGSNKIFNGNSIAVCRVLADENNKSTFEFRYIMRVSREYRGNAAKYIREEISPQDLYESIEEYMMSSQVH